VQSAAVNAGINPIFVLSLAAHESAFGCISDDYLGAYGENDTIEEQIQKLLDWINNTDSLEELLCVWRSGYTGLEFCPPFCSKYDLVNGGCALDEEGNPMTSAFPDGMRFWLQIFTLGQAGGCAISWL
jgi:hypothetical protein